VGVEEDRITFVEADADAIRKGNVARFVADGASPGSN